MVVTRRGYRQLLHATSGYNDFLQSVMASCTVLYLGFSFTDHYLNDLRSSVLSMMEGRSTATKSASSAASPLASSSPSSASASSASSSKSVSFAPPAPTLERQSTKSSGADLLAQSPIAYAVIPDQSHLDERFLRAHEGVQVLSWSTLGGKDFDGFGACECSCF